MAGEKMARIKNNPGIYRRGARYAYTWRDANGKQRWGSTRTFDEARDGKREKEREARAGALHVPTSEQVTLAAFALDLFGADLGREPDAAPVKGRYAGRHGAIRDNTRDDYRKDLERYWLRHLGSTRLPALTPPMIAKHLAKLAARDGDEYLADTTLRRVFAPFRSLLSVAVEEGLIPSNPARDVSVPGGRDRLRRFERDDADDDEDDRGPVRPYTRAQIASLLAVLMPQPQLRLLLFLLASTGLRISEALALRWRDVQLDGSTPCVRVRRSVVRGTFGPPKSKHGRRDVPISHTLVVELRRLSQRTDWSQANDVVFASPVGTPLRPENLRKPLVTLAQEADVSWTGFHGFRHAFASALIEDGRNIVQISRLLGHHSPAFTLTVYAHLMDDGVGGPLELDLTPPTAELEPASDVPGDRVEPAALLDPGNGRVTMTA